MIAGIQKRRQNETFKQNHHANNDDQEQQTKTYGQPDAKFEIILCIIVEISGVLLVQRQHFI